MTVPAAATALLASEMLGVLSTVGPDGRPQSALVGFSTLPGPRLVFGTSPASRKFANLLRDPRVSFVVSRGEKTAQLEGTARVAVGSDDAACRAAHVAKNPRAKKYADDPVQKFLVIEPSWIRYTDYGTDPDTVVESLF